jgi:phosphate/sulfate permease
MEAYWILIIVFLFGLAISLLVVGVSNDAVNFLNSAIGSKAAPFTVILLVAAAGVLLGATFSNGMMEVARKGIFNPQYFTFNEIMVVFLAVMLTNILLLDFFNTIGLPTSTTVSIVFGILGAAVAVAVFKVARSEAGIHNVEDFINIQNSMLIILGIFLSVVIAFNAGLIVQWLVRIAFSFNLGKTYKYWGGIWSGFAITAILYFLLIKGARGSTLVSPSMLKYIEAHTGTILLFSFAGWTLIFQIFALFTRINILKITVLVGTFALAMAFAGNDLVNFIGVPLAGFESFRIYEAAGGAEAGGVLMESLREPVNTPLFFLIIAGVIMVLTLWFSKKSRTVTATTIDLSRQDEGTERFASSSLARFLVRQTVGFFNGILRIAPGRITHMIDKRFDASRAMENNHDQVAFDQVRASVNLVVASILIAFGTSFKLPLSTTYVTFMVAMGTSLADGAWGRDSAVYRITGVLTVVSGWFFTALSATVFAFIIGTVIYFGKFPAILALTGLAVYILIRTHAFHKKKHQDADKEEEAATTISYSIVKKCNQEVEKAIAKEAKILYQAYTSFLKEKHKELKKLKKESRELNHKIREIQDDIPDTLKKFGESDLESGHYYVQVVTYMKEMGNALMHVVQPAFNHLDNNHSFDGEMSDKLKEFDEDLKEFFGYLIHILKTKQIENNETLNKRRDDLIGRANDLLRERIKILKKNKKGVKVSVTYIEMLTETKSLLLHTVQLVKTQTRLLQSVAGEEEAVKELVSETSKN